MTEELEILYQDSDFIAVNKPHGLLVHRTKMANDTNIFAIQLLRNQIGQKVYPIHRLDRKTSGVLLFGKNPDANRRGQSLFRERKVHKQYIALVRGHILSSGSIEYPLLHNNKLQDAITHYEPVELFEANFPSGKFSRSRFTLAHLQPEHGRFHQLRKHMAHIFHPIIGDRPHGCNKQNKLWKDRFNMTTMLLHAQSIEIDLGGHQPQFIEAKRSEEFDRAIEILRKNSIHKN